MVSSSTSICPASTRWDSKMSLSSSLPVCVASQGKSVHQCSHGNSIMTNRAKGLRRWSRECIHRTWFMQPICSLHGNCEWELNMSKNWNSSRKESQQVSFLRFWASSWIRYWLLQKKHPQKDVLRIFVGLLQPSLNGTHDVVQGICPAPWNKVRDLSSANADNDCTVYNLRQNMAKPSQWWLKAYLKSYVPFAWCHPAILALSPWNQVATVRIFQRVHHAAVEPSISGTCPVVPHALSTQSPGHSNAHNTI
jgi:hypothetical protein